MTNPKISVGADFSAVEKAVAALQAKVNNVNDSLNAGNVGIDIKDAKSKLDALDKLAQEVAAGLDKMFSAGSKPAALEQINAITSVLDEAGKAAGTLEQVLEAVGQSTGSGEIVKNAKAYADHIQRAARAQKDLGREGIRLTREQAAIAKENYDRLRQSGARGTSHFRDMAFDEWASGGWQNESVNLSDAKRKRRDVFRRIGIDLPEEDAPDRKPGSGGGRGNGSSAAMRNGFGRFAGGAAGALTGSLTGGGLGIGTIAGGLGGMVPGVGMALGPLAGAIGGMVDQALERAITEATDLSDLRRSLGATVVDFDQLRGTVRHFSDGLGISRNEAAKLARIFGHTANAAGSQSVGRETGMAAGFGRGFGMDPQAAVTFFATMRHYGATQTERDSKRLALSVAEAIQKGGVSPKADEALSAIQNYVQSATRASMTQANVEAYASFMSSLTGLSQYGIKGDPEAAASAMGKADAALRGGGAFGDASKSFSLGIYQRMLPGFSAFDMDVLNEQGAFGSVGRAFGKDSAAYAMARDRGDKSKMAQYDQWAGIGGDKSILSMQMKALEQTYGSSQDALVKAIMSHLGVGASEAMALYRANKRDGGLGSLQSTLEGAGVDVSKLNTRQIAGLAEIAGGSSTAVKGQADKLLGLTGSDKLSDAEREKLGKALAEGRPDEIRKVVLGLSALHDTTKDEGDEMRQIQNDINNAMQDLATNLIPLSKDIKEAVLRIANKIAPKTDENGGGGGGGGGGGDLPWWQSALNTIGLKGPDGNPYFKGSGGNGGAWWGGGSEAMRSIDSQISNTRTALDTFDSGKEKTQKRLRDAERNLQAARAKFNPNDHSTYAAVNDAAKERDAAQGDLNMYNEQRRSRMRQDLERLQRQRASMSGLSSGGGAGGVVRSYMEKVRSAESSGDDHAKNPRSSATGRYQFTDDTWVNTYKGVFGNTGESERQILSKRRDGQMQDRLMERLSSDNAEALRKAGLPVNESTLYLAHFAGIAGAIKILRNPNDSAASLLGSNVIKANPHLRGMTGAGVRDWAAQHLQRSHRRGNKVAEADGAFEKAPGGGSMGSPQLAAQDLRIDNRVIVLDRNGRELGNTTTQVQTRVGVPVPAGAMRA